MTATSDVETIPVVFDYAIPAQAGTAIIERPECGSEWSGTPSSVEGITATATAEQIDQTLVLSTSFSIEGDTPVAFFAEETRFVVLRDGEVVTPDFASEFAPVLYDTTGDVTTGQQTPMASLDLCDTAAEYASIWEGFDFVNGSESDRAEREAQAEAFVAENSQLPAGEYTIYAATPVVMGDQAAAGAVLLAEGITQLPALDHTYLATQAAYSPLADAPEIQEYCEDDGSGTIVCDVPADVIDSLLTRDVAVATIVDVQPFLLISEPVTVTVE